MLTVGTLLKAHVGRGAQSKINNGGLLNLCQFYAVVRRLLMSRQPLSDAHGNRVHDSRGGNVMHTLTPADRLLLLAQIFDTLEYDYADCYGSDGNPFPGGCENLMRKIINGWRQHEAEK